MNNERDELMLSLLIELKEDVSAIQAALVDMGVMKKDIDGLKRDVNIVRGVVLAVGAVFSLVVALFSGIFKHN